MTALRAFSTTKYQLPATFSLIIAANFHELREFVMGSRP
jgi:hypothetical protein